MKGKLSRFIGDRNFYRAVFAIAVPIILQMSITNLVTLIDNVMVGRLGTESMSGVSIVNQFVFIFNLVVFGALSGAGIFTAQYHGKGDVKGVRSTMQIKLISTLLIGVVGTVLFILCDDFLINTFLHEEGTEGDLELAFNEAKRYLEYAVWGFLPYSLSLAYATTLREIGKPVAPMIASFAAVGINFVLNLILIFGLLGAPALGVAGAAIATTVSRFAELFILLIWTHLNGTRVKFTKGLFTEFTISSQLVRGVLVKGMPILVNELLWSVATTLRNQCYSTRGLEVLAAVSIITTVLNVLNVVHMSTASAIGIMAGNKLGAGDTEEAKITASRMTVLACASALLIGAVMAALSGVFPLMYDVSDKVRDISKDLLIISGIYMVFYAFNVCTYYTIRSGGRVIGVMLMDSGFMCVIILPITAFFAYFTGINIYLLFAIGQGTEILKTIFASVLLKKFNWARQMVDKV